MKIKKSILLAILCMCMSVPLLAQTQNDEKILKDAEIAETNFKKSNSKMEGLINNSLAYAIFPNVGEGAFIVGAAAGNGVLYENGNAVGMAKLKKLDIGLQAGGEAYSLIMFFETEEALAEFKYDEFEFSGEASAVAVKKGKAIDIQFVEGVAAFVHSKGGLMADVSIGGLKFDYTPFNK
jgi:lipid-binding SYLF domain-containing protein